MLPLLKIPRMREEEVSSQFPWKLVRSSAGTVSAWSHSEPRSTGLTKVRASARLVVWTKYWMSGRDMVSLDMCFLHNLELSDPLSEFNGAFWEFYVCAYWGSMFVESFVLLSFKYKLFPNYRLIDIVCLHAFTIASYTPAIFLSETLGNKFLIRHWFSSKACFMYRI